MAHNRQKVCIVHILCPKMLCTSPKKQNFATKIVADSTMEHQDKGRQEQDIIFSRAVKAGKRIYYLDVKRNRNQELFVAITESKKIVSPEGEGVPPTFEKHKIFLYQEDFGKFADALQDVMAFVHAADEQPEPTTKGKYDIDIDFGV